MQTKVGSGSKSRDATALLAPARLPLVAVLVAAVPFVVHAWVALHGYFGQDDFVITYRAANAHPLDLGYLFQDYSGHLAPGTFLLAWLLTAIAPLNYPVAVVPLLVLHAVALLLWWRVLVRCFGTRWTILPPFVVLSCSPLILFPTLWWAYGMQLLPLLVAMAAAVLAHLRGAHLHSLLWTVGGLLFYEKAVLIAGVLFGITVLRGETVASALVKYRWVWCAHAVLIAGYLALYFGLTEDQAGAAPVSAGELGEFSYRAIVDTFLPGLLGGPLAAAGGGATWVTPGLAVRVVAGVAAVALIVFTLASGPRFNATGHHRQSRAAWLLLAGYLAVDLALVAVTRLAVVGPVIATDPRYVADAVPVAVLCATFACVDRRVSARWVVAGVTVLVAAGAIASFLKVAPGLQFREARDYVATARAALAERPDIALYDTDVPASVVIPWFIGDARASRVVGLLPEAPPFDRPADKLYRLDETGVPRPIGALADEVPAERGPVPDCGHQIGAEPVRIPLTSPVIGRRVLKIGYYTADAGGGTVTVGDLRVPVEFREGLHVLYVVVDGSFTHVEVARNLKLAPLCVTDLTAGVPR